MFTITWHFIDCVTIGDDDKCAHAMYREYADLEKLLHCIKSLQHRPFVTPDYILVEYHGYVFNVTNENSMNEFNAFLKSEQLQLANEWLVRQVQDAYRDSSLDSNNE